MKLYRAEIEHPSGCLGCKTLLVHAADPDSARYAVSTSGYDGWNVNQLTLLKNPAVFEFDPDPVQMVHA